MKQTKYLGVLVSALLLSALPAFAGAPPVGGKHAQSTTEAPLTQHEKAREDSAYKLGAQAYSYGLPRVQAHQAKGASLPTDESSVGKPGKGGSKSLGKGNIDLKGGGESSISEQGETEEVAPGQISSQGSEAQGEESVASEQQSVSDEEQNPLQFFEQMNQALTDNPPPAEHQGLMDSFKQIGVGPGQVFNPDQLDVPTRKGLTRAVEERQQFTGEQDSNISHQ